MWEDVAYYIDCTYKKEEIETAFIMGDGASYIKAGTEWIAKSVFVLDTFHLEEYINHLNYTIYIGFLQLYTQKIRTYFIYVPILIFLTSSNNSKYLCNTPCLCDSTFRFKWSLRIIYFSNTSNTTSFINFF